MQFIGNLYDYYIKNNHQNINIIVATSGDTGAAAIDAIKGKKNMNIFVLHPNNKISKIQRKLMTTVEEKNVFNIAIDGNFDDCQNIVKSMFSDLEFSKSIPPSISISKFNPLSFLILSNFVLIFIKFFLISNVPSCM